MSWKEEYKQKLCSPQEAVRCVQDGDRVYIGTCSTVAGVLTDALDARREELTDVTVCSGQIVQDLPIFRCSADGPFHFLSYFTGPGEREAQKRGNLRYTSMYLSNIDRWCEDYLPGCVAFLEVSPPDENGYMSYGAYGVSFHDYVRKQARKVVLQVNRQQPYTCGQQNLIHISQADAVVETDVPDGQVPDAPATPEMKKIAEQIVEQVPDGAVIQLGLGGLSSAIGYGLKEKNDLGIHSEMLTNSMMELIRNGNVTNRCKQVLPGKSAAAFAFGSEELYRFADHNEDLYFAPYTFINNPYVIARNDNVISINTAMAIDLYGQVAADNLGGRQQSSVGGQVDYVRGAQMSKGGRSYIALTSLHKNKKGSSSRIVAAFPPGTAVTTSRQDVQYVVTEYGCVNLKKLPMPDRARALIELAHPDQRTQLRDQAKALGLL